MVLGMDAIFARQITDTNNSLCGGDIDVYEDEDEDDGISMRMRMRMKKYERKRKRAGKKNNQSQQSLAANREAATGDVRVVWQGKQTIRKAHPRSDQSEKWGKDSK